MRKLEFNNFMEIFSDETKDQFNNKTFWNEIYNIFINMIDNINILDFVKLFEGKSKMIVLNNLLIENLNNGIISIRDYESIKLLIVKNEKLEELKFQYENSYITLTTYTEQINSIEYFDNINFTSTEKGLEFYKKRPTNSILFTRDKDYIRCFITQDEGLSATYLIEKEFNDENCLNEYLNIKNPLKKTKK